MRTGKFAIQRIVFSWSNKGGRVIRRRMLNIASTAGIRWPARVLSAIPADSSNKAINAPAAL